RMLQHENLGTFSHMITRTHELLREDKQLLAREQARARFIFVDEFQDANFAQVKILSVLSGQDRNVFAVGDPDQAIYRFRGASSAALGLFQRHFGGARLVVLDKNQRSMTPILQCAFSVIERNPPVPANAGMSPAFCRSVLKSAREERAIEEGKPLVSLPIEIVPLAARDFEAADIVAMIEEKRGQRCPWSDFAVLYRSHFHRDELAAELGERGIPFSIENMDVMDTSEVRDLLACLGAVNSVADAASLLRVAALPQFGLDPERIREAMRVAAREQREGRQASLASLLSQIEGGPNVLAAVRKTGEKIARGAAKSRVALDILVHAFGLDPNSPPLTAFLKFVDDWEKKAITRTGEIGELLDYLSHFREARGA